MPDVAGHVGACRWGVGAPAKHVRSQLPPASAEFDPWHFIDYINMRIFMFVRGDDHSVVQFELFELYYWLELYELYYKKIKFVKFVKSRNCVHNYKYG